MSGLIAADEKDYILSYSYFYETFEGYRAMNDITKAAVAFKFMLFSKIMNKQSDRISEFLPEPAITWTICSH